MAPRSVYRDIAALQAMRVPIEGERGLGYILRPGFNLPPLMFTVEEVEAVVLAVGLLDRTGDSELKEAARRVSNKIAGALPEPLRRWLEASALHAWGDVTPAPESVDLAILRRAIREERKLEIDYRDAEGRETHRVVWPAALIYYSDAVNLVAWCELRQALRHFRVERIGSARRLTLISKARGMACGVSGRAVGRIRRRAALRTEGHGPYSAATRQPSPHDNQPRCVRRPPEAPNRRRDR